MDFVRVESVNNERIDVIFRMTYQEYRNFMNARIAAAQRAERMRNCRWSRGRVAPFETISPRYPFIRGIFAVLAIMYPEGTIYRV